METSTFMRTQREEHCHLTIEQLMVTYYDDVFRLACSILSNTDDADDAAQEVFISVNNSLDQFRWEASPKTWLYTITVNRCRSMLRKRRLIQRINHILFAVNDLFDNFPSPEESTLDHISLEIIGNLIDTLPEKYRTSIILRYGHDLKIPEIAEILGLPEGTVHSRLRLARKKLLGYLLREKV